MKTFPRVCNTYNYCIGAEYTPVFIDLIWAEAPARGQFDYLRCRFTRWLFFPWAARFKLFSFLMQTPPEHFRILQTKHTDSEAGCSLGSPWKQWCVIRFCLLLMNSSVKNMFSLPCLWSLPRGSNSTVTDEGWLGRTLSVQMKVLWLVFCTFLLMNLLIMKSVCTYNLLLTAKCPWKFR